MGATDTAPDGFKRAFAGGLRYGRTENGAEKKKKRKAELQILHEQIKPHFLYNTLDTIQWMAKKYQAQDIVDIVLALSNFFRISLSQGKEYITLEQEVEMVKSYLDIQKFRYEELFDYQIDMEACILKCRVLKLSLQPLVENAVSHGLEGKIEQGTVRIIVENSAQTLFLRVRDNGIGMPEDQVNRLNTQFASGDTAAASTQQRGGIALRNVNSRIRLMFGENYGLHIFSAAGVGTECCVTLPLLLQEG